MEVDGDSVARFEILENNLDGATVVFESGSTKVMITLSREEADNLMAELSDFDGPDCDGDDVDDEEIFN